MKVQIDERNTSKVAVVKSRDIILSNAQSALDMMMLIQYEYGCQKVIIDKENVSEDFFKLKTGIAGEILQKFTNYHVLLAIIGDFSLYTSKSLHDFIYESNRGKQIFFLNSIPEALDILHKIPMM